MTAAAQQFITPLAAGALTADKVYTDLFDREAEQDVGHIRLARDTDLIIVAPATADLMAKMAQGLAGDLASTVLLATNRPVLVAPAMNPAMWAHPATQRNVATLKADGIAFIGPERGEMAESGEAGLGRMAEPLAIVESALGLLQAGSAPQAGPLSGKHVVITSGPTHEPIDPVRYIANRSSGKQGHAIAAAAAEAGARVTLISGPVTLPDPAGVSVIHVETAKEMLAAVEAALPADVAVMAAAVADWRVAQEGSEKIKKDGSGQPLPSRSLRTRIFSPPSATSPATGRSSSSALPPKRKTSSPMRKANCSARQRTGSSPMTSALQPASWEATPTPCASSPMMASRIGQP